MLNSALAYAGSHSGRRGLLLCLALIVFLQLAAPHPSFAQNRASHALGYRSPTTEQLAEMRRQPGYLETDYIAPNPKARKRWPARGNTSRRVRRRWGVGTTSLASTA
jgi:hypothetical protein